MLTLLEDDGVTVRYRDYQQAAAESSVTSPGHHRRHGLDGLTGELYNPNFVVFPTMFTNTTELATAKTNETAGVVSSEGSQASGTGATEKTDQDGETGTKPTYYMAVDPGGGPDEEWIRQNQIETYKVDLSRSRREEDDQV